MSLRTYIALRKIAADAALKAAGERSVPPQAKPDASQGPAPVTGIPTPQGTPTNTAQQNTKPYEAPKLGAGEGYYRTRSGGYAVAAHDTAKQLGWTQINDADEFARGVNQTRAGTNSAERKAYAAAHKQQPVTAEAAVPAPTVNDSARAAQTRLNTGHTPAQARANMNALRFAEQQAADNSNPYMQALGQSKLHSTVTSDKLLQSLRTDITPEQRAQAQQEYKRALGQEMIAKTRVRNYRGLGVTPGSYYQQTYAGITPQYWRGLGMYNPRQLPTWIINNG